MLSAYFFIPLMGDVSLYKQDILQWEDFLLLLAGVADNKIIKCASNFKSLFELMALRLYRHGGVISDVGAIADESSYCIVSTIFDSSYVSELIQRNGLEYIMRNFSVVVEEFFVSAFSGSVREVMNFERLLFWTMNSYRAHTSGIDVRCFLYELNDEDSLKRCLVDFFFGTNNCVQESVLIDSVCKILDDVDNVGIEKSLAAFKTQWVDAALDGEPLFSERSITLRLYQYLVVVDFNQVFEISSRNSLDAITSTDNVSMLLN